MCLSGVCNGICRKFYIFTVSSCLLMCVTASSQCILIGLCWTLLVNHMQSCEFAVASNQPLLQISQYSAFSMLYPRIYFSWTLAISTNGNFDALIFILYVYESAFECHIISIISLKFAIWMPYFIGYHVNYYWGVFSYLGTRVPKPKRATLPTFCNIASVLLFRLIISYFSVYLFV